MTALALVVLLIVLLDPGSTPNTAAPAASTRSAPAGSSTATAGPSARDPESGLVLVEVGSLPVQARQTVSLIERGGPYPYAKDGAVFGNRERTAAEPAQRVLPGVHRADAG